MSTKKQVKNVRENTERISDDIRDFLSSYANAIEFIESKGLLGEFWQYEANKNVQELNDNDEDKLRVEGMDLLRDELLDSLLIGDGKRDQIDGIIEDFKAKKGVK